MNHSLRSNLAPQYPTVAGFPVSPIAGFDATVVREALHTDTHLPPESLAWKLSQLEVRGASPPRASHRSRSI